MSNMSPDRSATSWSLDNEIGPVCDEAVQQKGRVARMLFKSPEVRVVVVGIAKGVTWPEHTAAGRVLVRVELGRIELGTQNSKTQLAAGMLVALEPGEPHDVFALEDSAFLVIVAGQPSNKTTK
jgi:quercetin dioxygenase-like cupin family protein